MINELTGWTHSINRLCYDLGILTHLINVLCSYQTHINQILTDQHNANSTHKHKLPPLLTTESSRPLNPQNEEIPNKMGFPFTLNWLNNRLDTIIKFFKGIEEWY